MTGRHRFLRIKGGRCHFAEAWVEASLGGGHDEIEDVTPAAPDASGGEVNGHTAPAWVAAALDGIREAVALARQEWSLADGCHVVLTRLVGTPADTREDAVRCAASLAAWQGLGLPEPLPEAAFDGRAWSLRWPARLQSPVHGTTS